MAKDGRKKEILDRIRKNIARSGHHTYVVSGGAIPRFAYTIGLSESIGIELVLAGAILYYAEELTQIIKYTAAQLKAQGHREIFDVAGKGSFTLRKVHSSWATELMLGAVDYYKRPDIAALQVVPDKAHWTIDVPDLSAPWRANEQPVWRWLREPWTYPVPENSTAATNLAALRGDRVTEAARWEENEWEICVGAAPDVPEEEMRVVPLGTLIGADESLVPVVNLPIGEGLWRDPDPDSEWHPWRKKEQEQDDDATRTNQ